MDLKSLLTEADALKKSLESRLNLMHSSIKTALDVEFTYESLRIEGGTLSLREVELIVNQNSVISNKSLSEHIEAINFYEAIDWVRDSVKSNKEFSLQSLLSSASENIA